VILAEWRNLYDFVIIDTAPILPVSDSHALAAKADIVLLVVRLERTKSRNLVRTTRILQRLGARVIGAVANDITSRSQGYAYHYYSTDYDYAANEADEQ
jgi:Mrp family chromosome partitioning ATPase